MEVWRSIKRWVGLLATDMKKVHKLSGMVIRGFEQFRGNGGGKKKA